MRRGQLRHVLDTYQGIPGIVLGQVLSAMLKFRLLKRRWGILAEAMAHAAQLIEQNLTICWCSYRGHDKHDTYMFTIYSCTIMIHWLHELLQNFLRLIFLSTYLGGWYLMRLERSRAELDHQLVCPSFCQQNLGQRGIPNYPAFFCIRIR